MVKSTGQGAPSSSRSFDCYDCTCNVTHMCMYCNPTFIQVVSILQFISCLPLLNCETNARDMKKLVYARYVPYYKVFMNFGKCSCMQLRFLLQNIYLILFFFLFFAVNNE